jgi:N-methylhydantoinase B
VTGVATTDAVTIAVIRAGLLNAVAEMKAVVLRTAYSNLWKEAGDLSCGLLSADADVVVQGMGDIPVHLASMPYSLRGCLARIPREALRPGDVLYQNDPYQGNNHLPDFLMAKPVFFGERIVGFAAVRGHYVDVGGGGPGSYSAAMPDIYAEGLRIPPVRIFEEGVINQDIVDVLLTNTRNSQERLGDLRSQYAGCVAAERRLLAFCERYGSDTVEAGMQEMLNASERLTRAAISEIPDGTYRFEDYCDGDGFTEEPIKIAVAVTIDGTEAHVDFTGSAPQVRGGMNAPAAVTVSASCYALKCLTDPENPANSGCYRPLTFELPEGTVVNPLPPAAVVAGNHETASRIADAIFGALAAALPDRVCAAGSGTSGVLTLGARIVADGRERQAVMVETHGAGQGGNSGGNGVNARRVNVGNTGNTPNEVLETTFPIRVLGYGITEDGGGAGRTRGGTGITRLLRLEHDATMTLTAERSTTVPYGLFGGLSAPPSDFWVQEPGGERRRLPSKTAPIQLPAGTVIQVRCAGGGGYGRLAEHSLESLQEDIDDGYVTPGSARDVYRVDLSEDLTRAEGLWVVTGRRDDE